MVKNIISVRKYQSIFYNQVMYEWEDDLSKVLNLPIVQPIKICYYVSKILNKINCISSMTYYIRQKKIEKGNHIAFLMNCRRYNDYFPYNVIPIFLDTFNRDYDQLLTVLKNVDCAIFTNYTTYLKVKERFPYKEIYYTPLGVSSKWLLEDFPDKDIDVIQIGRSNNLLHEWMLKYCQSHEGINYIYRDTYKNQHYISTLEGDIGTLDSRKEYMDILKRSKVSLVSTASVDANDDECEFFTPRFYESAAMLCHMIGRYGDTEERYRINIDSVCANVCSYDEFSDALDNAFSKKVNIGQYKEFLTNNSLALNVKNLNL